jgi:hypothetical protein
MHGRFEEDSVILVDGVGCNFIVEGLDIGVVVKLRKMVNRYYGFWVVPFPAISGRLKSLGVSNVPTFVQELIGSISIV